MQIPDEERFEREYAEAALIAVDWMRETARFTSEKVRVTARLFFFPVLLMYTVCSVCRVF